MNIAIVCEGFNRHSLLLQPWHRVYAISRRMAAKENLSVFIVSDKTEKSLYKEEIEGITLTRIDRSKLTGFLGKRALARVLFENNAEIIVWCGVPSSAVQLNHHSNQLKMIGRPIVWDIDMDVQNLKDLNRLSFRELVRPGHMFLIPQLLAMMCSRFIIKRVANSALISGIVVPSQAIKNSLCRIGVSPSKVRVISSTVEKEDFCILGAGEKDMLRSELGFDQVDFIVTYFGSPCTLRGTDIVVLSMKKILAAKKNAKLLLLSRREAEDSSVEDNTSNSPGGKHLENEEEYLRKLAREIGIEENVQIISGTMSRSSLRNYLLVSDVIALPFKHVFSEPPLSVLEAMSLGKVVVTTNLSTLSEIVGNNRGILIQPNSADSLAQAVLYLADNPDKSVCIGKNAQRFVAGLDSWDQIALHFEELLNEKLEDRS